MSSLPVIWGALIAFAVFAYVVLDGFDLGIGILYPLLKPGEQRDRAMNSVAPLWDGNETWLVFGGGGLMAAFPLAYAVILPALYAPIIAMLLALIFRGVAFEFRWRDPAHRPAWDLSFTMGSVVAALAQGITLGALLQGITVEGRAYAGGWWDWLTPFSLLTGASLVAGYALLGATWLIMKTEGALRERVRALARRAAWLTLGALVLVSLATPLLSMEYMHRWFDWPRVLYTAQVPLAVTVVALLLWLALRRGADWQPFVLTIILFALGMAGLGVSMFPEIVPGSLTLHEAAAPPESLIFMLVGAVILLPVILTYSGYAYWVFRGKVGTDGYHR